MVLISALVPSGPPIAIQNHAIFPIAFRRPQIYIRSCMKTLLLLPFLAVLCVPQWGLAQPAQRYHVVRILDGDTFDATDGVIRFRVRLAGIDAPETGSPYAKVATAQLRHWIGDRDVILDPIARGTDRYNRVLAVVRVGEGGDEDKADGVAKDVGLAMIESGLATYYRVGCVDYVDGGGAKYDYDPRPYVAAETTARAGKLRMWRDGQGRLPCAVRRGRVNGY